ncbi:MAG: N-acetylmuramoyl-L-alanine amidase, partial [Saprospiraceae bacterium]|nr:N-acetylmuramoyl-L-alanine amidase [Saprospiraceae bacterium]
MWTSLLVLSLLFSAPESANYLYYHKVVAKKGDGAITLLKRYQLGRSNCNLDRFYELNQLEAEDFLIEGRKYVIPVLVYRYNGKSIRSTIGDSDYEKAVRIKHYNEHILRRQLRKKSYTNSKILWVPYHELHCSTGKAVLTSTKTLNIPILGAAHADVRIGSNELAGKVFYILAGHGGPDPGAVGRKQRTSLCEDEYAYDVALRLYKLLWEKGA